MTQPQTVKAAQEMIENVAAVKDAFITGGVYETIAEQEHHSVVLTDSEIKSKIIQDALQKVKPVYREVVILRDIQSLSYEEISEITGLTIGTVKSRINRGRNQLQKMLKDIYKE